MDTKKINININKVDNKIKEMIIDKYSKGMSLREIEREFKVTRSSASKFLENKGIKKSKGNHHRYYYHDYDYFDKIDTQEKAYWLGFMYADGYIVNYKHNGYGERSMGITLSTKDEEHLLSFKRALRSTNPINRYIRVGGFNNPDKISYFSRIVLKSEKTVLDLEKNGCVPNKTNILTFPNAEQVPTDLIRHFIRGVFDGDGSISLSKDSRTSLPVYSLQIAGTESVVKGIKENIDMGFIIKEKRSDKVYYYRCSALKDFKRLYDYLYLDATVFLERKRNKFIIFENISKERV